uniref:Terminase ATPase subunit N-terminal domain-containing protein n=1 Tax=candidate division WOR-3 bacterium TaxID=2052148 RepID=A0A7C6ECG8_UNCW3
MAHGIDTKERAFQLYVQGLSFAEISQETKVNKKTLLRWKRNFGWDIRRDRIIQDVQKKSDKKQTEILSQLYDKTLSLWHQVTDELQATSFRSKEGALNAYQMLTNLIIKFRPDSVELKDEALKRVFDVLFRHPKIGPLIEKHKDELLAEIDKELKKI